MSKRTGRLKPKSKEMIAEAADIVRNSENDEAAIGFLKDTLDDDFPDMELGSMDLHEAIEVLGGEKRAGDREAIENLNEALGDFMKMQEKQTKTYGRKPKPTKRKRRRRKRK